MVIFFLLIFFNLALNYNEFQCKLQSAICKRQICFLHFHFEIQNYESTHSAPVDLARLSSSVCRRHSLVSAENQRARNLDGLAQLGIHLSFSHDWYRDVHGVHHGPLLARGRLVERRAGSMMSGMLFGVDALLPWRF